MKPIIYLTVLLACSLLQAAEFDLATPPMTDEAPAAGKRVRQFAPEYEGAQVYHSLYFPTDWKPGGSIR